METLRKRIGLKTHYHSHWDIDKGQPIPLFRGFSHFLYAIYLLQLIWSELIYNSPKWTYISCLSISTMVAFSSVVYHSCFIHTTIEILLQSLDKLCILCYFLFYSYIGYLHFHIRSEIHMALLLIILSSLIKWMYYHVYIYLRYNNPQEAGMSIRQIISYHETVSMGSIGCMLLQIWLSSGSWERKVGIVVSLLIGFGVYKKKPTLPWCHPLVFGHHEIFHLCSIISNILLNDLWRESNYF